VAAGPLVTTSDEEESSDVSLPPSPRSNVTSLNQNREACEHDHDYENVASPSGSSTAIKDMVYKMYIFTSPWFNFRWSRRSFL
jgi:hypothetical protein